MRRQIRHGNGWALDIAADHFMFVMIVIPYRTIDVAVDVDRAVSGRIPCNGAVKWFPGGIVCYSVLASEGVWVI